MSNVYQATIEQIKEGLESLSENPKAIEELSEALAIIYMKDEIPDFLDDTISNLIG